MTWVTEVFSDDVQGLFTKNKQTKFPNNDLLIVVK